MVNKILRSFLILLCREGSNFLFISEKVQIKSLPLACCSNFRLVSQPAITCSMLTRETPEQGVKYVQS